MVSAECFAHCCWHASLSGANRVDAEKKEKSTQKCQVMWLVVVTGHSDWFRRDCDCRRDCRRDVWRLNGSCSGVAICRTVVTRAVYAPCGLVLRVRAWRVRRSCVAASSAFFVKVLSCDRWKQKGFWRLCVRSRTWSYVVVRGRTWSYVVVHGRCTRSKTKQIKRTEHKRSMNVARSVQKSVNNDVLFFFIYILAIRCRHYAVQFCCQQLENTVLRARSATHVAPICSSSLLCFRADEIFDVFHTRMIFSRRR